MIAMAISKSFSSVLRCSNCRSSFYRSLASLSGLDLTPVRQTPIRRAFSTSQCRYLGPTRQSQASNVSRKEQATPGLAGLEEVAIDEEIGARDAPELTRDSSLPWYLQIQEQEREKEEAPRSLAERQRLPELPPEPPPILQTLLEHLSIDVGLDDLSLLDLRDLDPPPALGANLIMVVGTARSEKHLHVSADRFCRYLRSTHKLRAHADGLLGRGELKIRMRRQARRARLMANVGGTYTKTDEFRTGWVCVLIDGIEPSPNWTSSVPQKEDIVGFDERSDKVTLAVQMFTEEKREDIDLEKLWTGRSLRSQMAMDGDEGEGTALKEAVRDDAAEEPKSAQYLVEEPADRAFPSESTLR